MRNIGLFTLRSVGGSELIDFVHEYCARTGREYEDRQDETVVGREPDLLYIFHDTAATQGYFGGEELDELVDTLGSTPRSYISIHFTSTADALDLANAITQEMNKKWGGLIDYGGMGGALGIPPTRT